MKRFFKFLWRFAYRSFLLLVLVLVVLAVFFFFKAIPIPTGIVNRVAAHAMPTNCVLRVGSVSLGFMRGLNIRDVALFDRSQANPFLAVFSFDDLTVSFLKRRMRIEGLKYPRLPDSYYAPGNYERMGRIEATFPDLPDFRLVLVRPDILGVAPERVTAKVSVEPGIISAKNVNLVWPDLDRHLEVNGECIVDLGVQRVRGYVDGLAFQRHIRPMMLTLDIPVAMPYYDGFTDVTVPVPAYCSWDVNLYNNDLDLELQLHPTLGAYNAVPMAKADGRIHLHVYTRGDCMNYHTEVGPIDAVDTQGRTLKGTVDIVGTNRYNTVTVKAESSQPIADLLHIGGFVDDYVGSDVFGDSTCELQFRFPRAMTNNYEVMDGYGHVKVKNGRLMRMKGFAGLVELMAEKVPGVSMFTDITQASCDYVIEKGVLKTDNLVIEGSFFSIYLSGTYDTVHQEINFITRVQLMREDSTVGKILNPLAWPFRKLMEFRFTGTPSNPKWEYVSVFDRVKESF